MPATEPRPPSIRDVARIAEVSHQTVSRVLSDFPSVSEETRSRVLAAVSQVGYRPNTAARSLVTRRSRTIGVLASSIPYFGPASSIAEIERAAREFGYRMSLTTVEEPCPASVNGALDFLLGQRVEALAIISPHAAIVDAVRKEDLNIPVVFVEPLTDGDDAAIAFDQVQGARRAVEHLARLGHRGIAHIAGPCGSLEAEARMRGFLEGMASCNLPETRPILSDWTAEGGYRAGLELLAEGRTTGVIAANDHTAIGVLHACRELRLRVPEDISVIGFDDIPEAVHVAPALTTLRQDFQLVGRMALRYLMGELGSGERVRTGLLRPELILRESTGPVPEPRPGHILAKEPG